MIYELRMYSIVLGKMQTILKRFKEGELKLFEKHGMKVVGVWTSLVGGESDVLYYMVGYKDLADRDRCWQSFRDDPEWKKLREESEKDGPLVSKVRNMLLTPTDFSP